jgi:hypothetical protein
VSKKKVTDYQFDLRLDTGAHLEVLVFNEYGENMVRWIFTYRFLSRDTGRFLVPKVVIDYSLCLNYVAGQLTDEVELTMNVTIPEKLGKQSFAGVDISPGAKTYLRFLYRRVGPKLFRLAAVGKGANPLVELPDEGEGLMKQTELPFVLVDRLEREGVYRVPFHSHDREHSREDGVSHFYFPESITRYMATPEESLEYVKGEQG